MAQTQTSPTSSLLVDTPSGPIEGFQDGSVTRFTGVPYATAERFRAPVAITPWTETLKANTPSPACPQPEDPAASLFLRTPILEGLKISEHCQYLSITVPSKSTDSNGSTTKLPVMVWFHGGAFVNGAGDAPIYNPKAIVEENNVVVVNVTSRLGVFGYLGDGTPERPANMGLLDVLESLRWVRKNIASFGGNDDPKSITIFGQSAGGSTVSDIMATEEATSLFGRVIIQSAPFGVTRGRDAMNKSLYAHVKHAHGNDNNSGISEDDMVNLTEKIRIEGRKFGNMGGMPFASQYGYAPLPDEKTLEATLDTKARDLDILIGWTAEEASLFIDFIPLIDKASHLPLIGSSILRAFVTYATSALYIKGAKSFATRHVKAGGKASTYVIEWGSKDPRLGAAHACELPLLFGNEKVWAGSQFLEGHTWESTNDVGRRLRKIWADFAKGKQVGSEESIDGVVAISRL